MTRLPGFLVGYLLLIALVVLLAHSIGVHPWQVFTERPNWQRMTIDITRTFLRVTVTVSVSWLLSVILGKLMQLRKWLHSLLMPSINFIRHISPYVFLPFAIIWFGIGEPPLYFVMIVALVFTGILMAFELFLSVPPSLLDQSQICGANQLEIFWYIELPVLRGGLVNLYRILWGAGWTAVIAAEMLGVQNGAGFRLLDFRYLLQYPQMIRYVLVIGLVGVIVDRLLEHTARKIEV